MSEIESFSEWVKKKPAAHKAKKASVKNPNIDSFLKSVDNLKKDMDELDVIEKKEKSKPKSKPEGKKPEEKKIDTFKTYKNKRDSEEGKEDEDTDDVDDSMDNSDERLRLPIDVKVPRRIDLPRGEPSRPHALIPGRLGRKEFRPR